MLELNLNKNETIELEIIHSKKLPFRLEDWLRSMIFIGFTIAAIVSLSNDGIISFGAILLLCTIILGILPLYQRWRRLQSLIYIVTNQRLILYNKKRNIIERSFEFNQFPEIHLRENAYNSGYIIIGEVQPTFKNFGLFGLKGGINLRDHEIVLENIPEVRKIVTYLKSKIGTCANCKN